MLEKIMNLQILFCIMAASGASGAVGMLAVHLTYRRILRKTNAVTSLKEKWLNLWKKRQTAESNESSGLDPVSFINGVSGIGGMVCDKA